MKSMKSMLAIIPLLLVASNAFALDEGPNPNSTLATYCANGICHTPNTHATTVSTAGLTLPSKSTNLIGIQVTQACEALLKHNYNSTCLPYSKMQQFDNTNPFWAGHFISTPWYHRTKPMVPNFYNFQNTTFVVMVDPTSDFSVRAKMIYVGDKNFTYINKNDVSTNGGLSTISYINRSMSGCDEALIAPDLGLLNDTIHYMESGCVTTHYNTTKITTQKEIPFDWSSPFSSTHAQKFVYSIKKTGGLGDCITHKCNFTDPYKKAGWD